MITIYFNTIEEREQHIREKGFLPRDIFGRCTGRRADGKVLYGVILRCEAIPLFSESEYQPSPVPASSYHANLNQNDFLGALA